MKLNLKNHRPGDIITRVSVIPPRVDTSFKGVPMKVKAVSLPFIYCDVWDHYNKNWISSSYSTIDTREWEVMRISKNALS